MVGTWDQYNHVCSPGTWISIKRFMARIKTERALAEKYDFHALNGHWEYIGTKGQCVK
jgi:hypothetical protein